MPSLVEFGSVVLEKKILKIWKVYDDDDDNDYDNANGQLTNFTLEGESNESLSFQLNFYEPQNKQLKQLFGEKICPYQ